MRFLPLLGARQNTHCPWWAALDSNQAKLNYQFYRLARYLLRYTDPYYLTLGGSSWTQTRTSIRRRIYRNLLKNPAVKVFIKSRKRNRVSPSAVSINSTNDPYLNISIIHADLRPTSIIFVFIQSVRRHSLSFGERPLTSGPSL